MNISWHDVLTEVLGAFLNSKFNFVVGSYSVSIGAAAGGKREFSLATALFAAESVFLTKTGVVQIGDVVITIAEIATGSNASPEAATLATAIAASVTPSGASGGTLTAPEPAPLAYAPVGHAQP